MLGSFFLFLLILHVRSSLFFFFFLLFLHVRSIFLWHVLGCFPCTNMYVNYTYYNMIVSRVGIEHPRLNFKNDNNKREL